MASTVMQFDEPAVPAPAPERDAVIRSIADDVDVIGCEQGSADWYLYRAGAITGSMFSEVRRIVGGLTDQQREFVSYVRAGLPKTDAATKAGYKKAPSGGKIEAALAGERVGDYSTQAHDYAFRLAIERASGQPLRDQRFETYDMRRGHELEPDARALHGVNTGLRIDRAGIVRTKDGRFGASADGLIDVRANSGRVATDGGSEYKCFTSPEKVRSILLDRDLSEYMDQIQGGMWLTGRSWWHFGLYVDSLVPAGLELTLFEVERDDDYIADMEADLVAFDRLVESYRARIADVKPDAILRHRKATTH